MNEALPSFQPESVAQALCGWFASARRDLPWRHTRDPYAILLSEIMLQQTRVDTVIPYYQRFLERFPSIEDLAGAPLDEVLSAWSGLGYYRRARSLHLAAREVTERFAGHVPAELSELLSLPGIGAYTAGAIASIAYGRKAPIVDGNVARVLARLFGIEASIDSGPVGKQLWALSARLVAASEEPGDLNQALMELGALVCTPSEPKCSSCPLREQCVAFERGLQSELPRRTPKRAPKEMVLTCALISGKKGHLLGKRPERGLFAGLWEPPMLEGDASGAREMFASAGVSLGEPLGELRHILTHRVLKISVFAARAPRLPKRLSDYEKLRFSAPGAEQQLSTLARKILALAEPRKAP